MPDLTQELVRSLFEYRDGALYWRADANANGTVIAGSEAGYARSDGRVQIRVARKLYYSYRLIYLYHHGFMPLEVDHIDGNPANNRIDNLRAADRIGNQMNCPLRSDNTTGYKGVYRSIGRHRYTAQLNKKHLGTFDAAIDAARAYNAAARNTYGEYAWLNPV